MASDKVDGINYLTISKGDDTSYFEIAKAQLGDGAKEAKIEALAGKIEELNENKKLKEGDQVFIPFEYAVDEMQANVKAAQNNVTTKQTALQTAQSNLSSASSDVASKLSAYNEAQSKTKKVDTGKKDKNGKPIMKEEPDTKAINAAKTAYEEAVKKEAKMKAALETAQTNLDSANEAVENANKDLDAAKAELKNQEDLSKKEKQEIEQEINKLQQNLQTEQNSAKQDQEQIKAQAQEANLAATQNQAVSKKLGDNPSKDDLSLAMNNTISSIEYIPSGAGEIQQRVKYADGTTAENTMQETKDKDGNKIVYYGNAEKDDKGNVKFDKKGNVIKEKDDNGYSKPSVRFDAKGNPLYGGDNKADKGKTSAEAGIVYGGEDGKTKYTILDTLYSGDDGDKIELEDGSSLSLSSGKVYKVKDKKGNERIFVQDAKDLVIDGEKSDEDLDFIVESSEIDKILTGDGDDKIEVNNSEFKYKGGVSGIDSGKGDDKIKIYYTTFKDAAGIQTDEGDDEVDFKTSKLERGGIHTYKGNDKVHVYDASSIGPTGIYDDKTKALLADKTKDIGLIETGTGTDKIVVENSTVKKIDGGDDADGITLNGAKVGQTFGLGGSDVTNIKGDSWVSDLYTQDGEEINIVDSLVNNIYGPQSWLAGESENVINAENAYILNIEDDKSKNTVYADAATYIDKSGDNTDIKKRNWSETHDTYSTNPANVNEVQKTITDKNKATVENAEALADHNQKEAQTASRSIAEKYFGKDAIITTEQETQAILIDTLDQNLLSMQYQFENQENEDGWVGDAYNWCKGLLDCGVTKDDINKAIDQQEDIINGLKDALTGKSDKYSSFEEAYKDLMGVEYDEEKITTYVETYNTYKLATTGISKANETQQSVLNADNLQEVFDAYKDYYNGDEKLARQAINDALKEETAKGEVDCNLDFAFLSTPDSVYLRVVDAYIDENNQLVYEITGDTDSKKLEGCINGGENADIEHLSNGNVKCTLNLKDANQCFGKDSYGNVLAEPKNLKEEFTDNFENAMGISINSLQTQLAKEQTDAVGTHSVFQNLLDNYCNDQNGVADKVSEFLTGAGLVTMVGGAVVSIFCPPAGAVMMKAGGKIMVAGMFADEGLGALNEVTSENCDSEELNGYFKEFATDAALYYSGKAINVISSSANAATQGALGANGFGTIAQKCGGYGVEVMLDGSLSLAADYIITGNVDFTGEGFNQLMGIATGIANSKINQYSKKISSSSLEKYSDNPEAAIAEMKENGLSTSQIKEICDTTYGSNSFSIDEIKNLDYKKVLKSAVPTGKTNYDDYKIYDSVLANDAETAYKQYNELYESGVIKTDTLGENLYNKSNLDILVESDINKLYEVTKSGGNVTDAFVPKYSSTSDATSALKTGDICRVGGSDKVSIKQADGTMKELNLSAKKYMELFPPVERYSYGQQQIGDCYLVSSSNALYKNPNTRAQVLECYTENADGSVTVKLPDSDYSYTLKAGKSVADDMDSGRYFKKTYNSKGEIEVDYDQKKVQGSNDSSEALVKGCEGMKMFEYAYGLTITGEKISNMNDTVEMYRNQMTQNQKAAVALMEISNNPYKSYTVDELRSVLNSKYNGVYDFSQTNLHSIIKQQYGIKLDGNKIVLENRADVITSINKYANNSQKYGSYAIAAENKLNQFANTGNIEQTMRNNGWSKDVLARFDFGNTQIFSGAKQPYTAGSLYNQGSNYTNMLKAKFEEIADGDTNDYVMTAGTLSGQTHDKYIDFDKSIAYGHEYTIKPIKYGNTLKILVTNPWNNGQTSVLTYDEFIKYFGSTVIAKVA